MAASEHLSTAHPKISQTTVQVRAKGIQLQGHAETHLSTLYILNAEWRNRTHNRFIADMRRYSGDAVGSETRSVNSSSYTRITTFSPERLQEERFYGRRGIKR